MPWPAHVGSNTDFAGAAGCLAKDRVCGKGGHAEDVVAVDREGDRGALDAPGGVEKGDTAQVLACLARGFQS